MTDTESLPASVCLNAALAILKSMATPLIHRKGGYVTAGHLAGIIARETRMDVLRATIEETMAEIKYHHADMLTEHERNHPSGSGWARVYDKLAAARNIVSATDKEGETLTADPLLALELALPVLREVVASGLLGCDERSDRLALDAVESAIAKANAERAT